MRILYNFVVYNRRLLRDYTGSFLIKNWKKVDNKDIFSVDNKMIKDVFYIYTNNFDVDSTKMIIRYSKIFRDIFYIAKSENDIVGYCIYYIKPIFSLKTIKKTSVIYSIAIDKKYRQKGLGKRLLDHSIAEMELNGISSIYLYVDKENLPAINLYKSKGFKIVEKLNDICGKGRECYKMELRLME